MIIDADHEHIERLDVEVRPGETRIEAVRRQVGDALGEAGRTAVERERTWIDGRCYEHAEALADWLEGEGQGRIELLVDHEREVVYEPARLGDWSEIGRDRFSGGVLSAASVLEDTLAQIAERGEALYERHHRARCEREAMGQFVAVDVRSGAATVDPDSARALERAREKAPQGVFHLLRAGQRGAFQAYAA